MNTATHTATPWNDVRIGRNGDGSALSAECQIVNPQNEAVMLIRHDGSPKGWANVEFMVMACSAHEELAAELKRREASDERNWWAVMHAAGFGALLSEILGSGCLTRERHRDLYDRVVQAANDHENHIRAALAKAGA